MVGNVLEWTEDCWEGACGLRVLRGGHWDYRRTNFALVRVLGTAAARTVDSTLGGFRVARRFGRR